MKRILEIRDGEATLERKIFESTHLREVIEESKRRGMTFDRLAVDNVAIAGVWKSTEESTAPMAIIYLESKTGYDHLITRAEDKYALYKYHRTP